ncbi:acyl-CoA thioesterase II, partial [Acinetobacter baumannii]
MNALTQELVELLTLEKLEENIYRGISRNLVGKRVFGGQVLGQALRAASYTTDR